MKNIHKDLQIALLDIDEARDAYLLEVSIIDSNPHRVLSIFWFTPTGVYNDTMFTGNVESVSNKLELDDHARMMVQVQTDMYAHYDENDETLADVFSRVHAIGFRVPQHA